MILTFGTLCTRLDGTAHWNHPPCCGLAWFITNQRFMTFILHNNHYVCQLLFLFSAFCVQVFLSAVSYLLYSLQVLILADSNKEDFLYQKLPVLSSMIQQEGKATAYVCQDFTCALPVTCPQELRRLLLEWWLIILKWHCRLSYFCRTVQVMTGLQRQGVDSTLVGTVTFFSCV